MDEDVAREGEWLNGVGMRCGVVSIDGNGTEWEQWRSVLSSSSSSEENNLVPLKTDSDY